MNRLTSPQPPLPGTTVDPRYPDSDGRYMGETEFHNVAMGEIRNTLVLHYKDDPGLYVASNIVWYFAKDHPEKHRDPDVLVARGVRGKHKRRSFRAWEEKVTPCVLFEIASKKTWRIDIGAKRDLYASLGVKEYFVFDPEGCFLDPVLQGFKSVAGQPVPLKARTDGSLVSKQLRARLLPEGDQLRFLDLKTGVYWLTPVEQALQEKQLREQEQQLRKQETQRADALAAELERVRAAQGQHRHPER